MTTPTEISAITAPRVQCVKDKGKFQKKKMAIPLFEVTFTLDDPWKKKPLYLKACDDQGNPIDHAVLPIQNPFNPKNSVAEVFFGDIGIWDVPDSTKVIFRLYSDPSMTGTPIASNETSSSAEFVVIAEGACP